MSPTVFREKGYRFYFFSREEARPHIHVVCGDGEAKYWIVPSIELAVNHRLSPAQLSEVEQLIKEHHDQITGAWQKHFSG